MRGSSAAIGLAAAVLGCTGAMAAYAQGPGTLSGAVHDARGDASVSPFNPAPAADARRVSVSYDPAAGTLALEAWLWSPAPSTFQLKALFVSPACGAASAAADVLDFDLGGSAILRIDGAIPASVTRRTALNGRRLTESWSGPELRSLRLGCVRGSIATGGVGGFELDEFGPFALR
jgi:hypothetical protein